MHKKKNITQPYYSCIQNEYYSYNNIDELRGYDAKWNNHIEKEKYHMISLQCGIWKTKQAKQNEKPHMYREETGGSQRRWTLEGRGYSWRELKDTNFQL